MRVMVLGAGGFIGRRVADALDACPWATPVRACHRWPGDTQAGDVRVIDATDERQLHRALRDVDGVVNCVAGRPAAMVGSARALFRAAIAQARPPRVVHLSSMSVYGLATGVTDESGELTEDPGRYSSAKIAAEHLAAAYPAVVTLRPSCVFGPGSPQWSERIAGWLLAHRIGDLGSAGDGWANLLYIDDLVAAILSALRLPGIEGQAFNLSMADPPTWNDYFRHFALALGAVPLSRISQRQLQFETRVLAPPLQVAELLLRGVGLSRWRTPAPIPASLLRLWKKNVLVDGRKAQHLMQLQMTPLAPALTQTARWCHERRSQAAQRGTSRPSPSKR